MLERLIGWLEGFTEAGRAISGKNSDKLRQIHDHAAVMLEMGCAPGRMKESWRSFGENSQAVQSAICDLIDCGCWIQDMWDDRAVYHPYDGDGFYEVSYTIDADGKVALGTPVQVRPVTTYEPVPASLIEPPEPAGATGDMTEADAATLEGDCIPLIEAQASKNGTIPIKIIAPGWGSSGYYAESVLKRDIPAAFPIGTKMYWNHPTATEAAERPERDLDFLAAKTVSTPTWRTDRPEGPGMYAEAEVYTGYADKVASLAADIGLSIIAAGYAKTGEAEGRSGPIIEKIVRGESIDFVTTPGAGGKILTQFAEAARSRPAAVPQQESTMTLEELEQRIAQLEADNARLREAADARTAEASRLREAHMLARTREIVSATLQSNDELLPITRDRLFAEAIKNPPMKDGALDEPKLIERAQDMARVELAYLASAGGTGRIVGMGGSAPQTLSEAEVQQQLAATFSAIGLSESGAALAARGRS